MEKVITKEEFIEKFIRIQARKYKDIKVIIEVCGSLGTLGKKKI